VPTVWRCVSTKPRLASRSMRAARLRDCIPPLRCVGEVARIASAAAAVLGCNMVPFVGMIVLRSTGLGPHKVDLIMAWSGEAAAAQQKGDSFDAFFRLWMGFNAFLSAVTGEDRDAKMICSIGRNVEVGRRFEDLKRGDASFSPTLEAFSSLWPVYSEKDASEKAPHLLNAFGVDARALSAQLDAAGVSKQPSDVNSRHWGDTIRVIYQVRCNLFHGGKSPLQMRDWELVDGAYNVLAQFINGAQLYA
jgi:hypothetical protein